MSENTVTFGEYIRKKRETMGLSLRKAAEQLGMAATYLSDVERDKRYAPEKYLEAIKLLLQIPPEQEYEYYDLAGKSRTDGYPDLKEYLDSHSIVRNALRRARDMEVSDELWISFIDSMGTR